MLCVHGKHLTLYARSGHTEDASGGDEWATSSNRLSRDGGSMFNVRVKRTAALFSGGVIVAHNASGTWKLWCAVTVLSPFPRATATMCTCSPQDLCKKDHRPSMRASARHCGLCLAMDEAKN
jgi:hypothetical protein